MKYENDDFNFIVQQIMIFPRTSLGFARFSLERARHLFSNQIRPVAKITKRVNKKVARKQ